MKNIRFKNLLLLLFLVSSCGTTNQPTSSSTGKIPSSSTTPIDASSSPKDVLSDYVDHQEEFSLVGDENNFTKENNVYTILAAGEYTAKGKLENGKILVNAPNEKVTIRLEGVSMSSDIDSIIYVEDADKVTIKAIDGTYNEILDKRSLRDGTEEDEAGSAAIYAKTDLAIQGAGSLYVSSSYNNGIHAKKDLDIKKLKLKVKAIHNALKGNNSISIASGELTIISEGGDGLKTSDSKVTSKGNQKGSINITGGNIDIYASCDAIDAAYDFNMSDSEESSPVVRLFTDKFSSYSTTVVENSSSKMYIRTKTSLGLSYRYAGCFYNSDEDYVWKNATYTGTDDSRRYYIYSMDRPSSYKNVQFYRFSSTQSENSLETYDAKSEGGLINSNKDMFAVTSISSQLMEGTWTTYTTSTSGGFNGGSQTSHKSDHSAKGVKAQNAIQISGGTMTITANDDGLHANSGETLENGSVGVGDITITGGKLLISSSDDGIHADHIGRFSNAQIEITDSYEGIEANQLYFYSGTYYVKADDDGINACNGSEKTLIQVEGGYVDVTVGSGDTDAIDSNGDYKQTGGFVVARCGANDNSGNMAALDIDGTFYMEGGTFIGAGSMGATPSNSKVNYVRFGSSSSRPGGPGGGPGGRPAYGSSTTFTQGEYTISNTEINFTLNQSYSNLFICSDQLALSTSYTLTNGTTTKTWTQSSNAVTGE